MSSTRNISQPRYKIVTQRSLPPRSRQRYESPQNSLVGSAQSSPTSIQRCPSVNSKESLNSSMQAMLDLKGKLNEKELELLNMKNTSLRASMDHDQLNKQLKQKIQDSKRSSREIEEMKRQLSEKENQIQELKSILSEYDTRFKEMNGSIHKQLADKEVEISVWKEKYANTESTMQDRWERENSKMIKKWSEIERKNAMLVRELECSKKLSGKIETTNPRGNTTQLLREIDNLTDENQRLKDRINSQSLASEECVKIDEQIQELEEMQTVLVNENVDLKKKLKIAHGKLELQENPSDKFGKIGKSIFIARNELVQLAKITEILAAGKELSLNVLIGVCRPEQSDTMYIDPYEYWQREVELLRQEIAGLKTAASDHYAEKVGSVCATQ